MKINLYFLLLLILLNIRLTYSAATCPAGQVSIKNVCQTNDLSSLSETVIYEDSRQLQWQINANGYVDFLITIPHKGYFSLGFGSSMRNLDLGVILINNNEVVVLDYFVNGEIAPTLDSSQDFIVKGYEIGTSSVKVKFSRKLNTGDSSSDKILTQGLQTWCMAENPNSQSLIQHTEAESFSINFVTDITINDNSNTSTTTTTTDLQSIFYNGVNKLQYQVFTNDTIDILIDIPHKGYFTIGFSSTMNNLDLALIQITNNIVTVKDYYVNGHNNPILDTIQDFTVKEYQINANSYSVKFSRKLSTGDTTKDKILSLGQQTWCYAENTGTQNFIQHSKFGSFQINLALSSTQTTNNNQTQTQCTNGQISVNNVCQNNDLTLPSNKIVIYDQNTLYWQVNSDNTIDFLLSYSHLGYFAIGFSSTMNRLDFFSVSKKNNEVIVQDYYVNGHTTTTLDTQNDYKIKGYEIGANTIKVKVNRKENTGDILDTILGQGQLSWCYADNPGSTDMIQHTKYGKLSAYASQNNKNSAYLLKQGLIFLIFIILSLI